MGFRDLEKVLDEALPKFSNDPFRYSYIKCLREINGNLDSISLSLRAFVEVADKQRLAIEKLVERLAPELEPVPLGNEKNKGKKS